jgi:hypothetical protein
MPMSPEDRALFVAHLEKFPHTCPVCGNNGWALEGPVIPALLGQFAIGMPGGRDAVPMALAICTQCFHIQEFAWIPIKTKLPRLTADDSGRGQTR